MGLSRNSIAPRGLLFQLGTLEPSPMELFVFGSSFECKYWFRSIPLSAFTDGGTCVRKWLIPSPMVQSFFDELMTISDVLESGNETACANWGRISIICDNMAASLYCPSAFAFIDIESASALPSKRIFSAFETISLLNCLTKFVFETYLCFT